MPSKPRRRDDVVMSVARSGEPRDNHRAEVIVAYV
jgi:hypothetical protein